MAPSLSPAILTLFAVVGSAANVGPSQTKESRNVVPTTPNALAIWLATNIVNTSNIPEGMANLAKQRVVVNLYTSNSLDPERIYTNDSSSLLASSFNKSHPCKICVHRTNGDTQPGSCCYALKDAFLTMAQVNMFLVDWSTMDIENIELNDVFTVAAVGEAVAALVDVLRDNGANTSAVTLIGDNQGAQIAAKASEKTLSPRGILWGIDVQGVDYDGTPTKPRFNRNAAGYTAAIHTTMYPGTSEAVAMRDIFVNYGSVQPGCMSALSVKAKECSSCYACDLLVFSILNPQSPVTSIIQPDNTSMQGVQRITTSAPQARQHVRSCPSLVIPGFVLTPVRNN
ncbi:hypothetical protein ONE63_003489 [Megalurothrips usitatus]|uniref:Lipase domain-containing protein n=1 Tax=Megalurothrips usitatus TaxID=439358 RepID=A0AAV7X6K4_9NEOP|nr:hypothetical protein ONE63_003489 [Megalurothrips usitatus]